MDKPRYDFRQLFILEEEKRGKWSRYENRSGLKLGLITSWLGALGWYGGKYLHIEVTDYTNA
jgi:hypothetical protein